MAQVRQRGRNSYLIAIYLGRDARGKRRWHRETFRGTEKEAQHRAAELEVKHRKSRIGPHGAMTVGEYLERWLVNIEGTVAERTLETYTLQAKHLIAAAGDLALYGLTGFDLETRLKVYFRDQSLAPATVRCIYGVMRTALRRGRDGGVIDGDLAVSLRPPRVPRKERRVLTPEELARLLDVARGYKHHLVIRVLALTGMRLGEALGLRWQDVDLERRTLTVRQSVNVRARKVNDRLKTAASYRTLALDRETVELLVERKRGRGATKVAALGGLIFCAEDGRPVRAESVRAALGRALRKAGLAHIRVHDLRHTAGSLMLDAGQPLATVSAFLGHSSTATTAAVYSHPVRKGASLAEVLNLEPSRKEP